MVTGGAVVEVDGTWTFLLESEEDDCRAFVDRAPVIIVSTVARPMMTATNARTVQIQARPLPLP